MIEFDNFCILHMPRCGGSFIEQSIEGAVRRAPGHEGWAYFAPFEKDVYGLIREPKSWYLSLHAYSMENNLIWKRAFGVSEEDDIDTAMRKWITGSHARDSVIEVPQMGPQNIFRQMQNLGIGFWSWWVLHMYGIKGGLSRTEELAEGMTLLWLHERERDLAMLEGKYGCKIRNPDSDPDIARVIIYSRNASERLDKNDVFDADLVTLLHQRDALVHATAILQPLPS